MSADVKKKSNAGFSLVELMVVVAIIAVLIGAVAITYSIVGKANAKSYATTMKQALSSARSETMGRVQNTYQLIVTCDSDGTAYVQVGQNGRREEVASSKIPIKIYSGGENHTMTPGMVFTMKFSKSDGRVTSMTFGYGEVFQNPSELCFECGPSAGRHYTVHVIKQTGKVYMD